MIEKAKSLRIEKNALKHQYGVLKPGQESDNVKDRFLGREERGEATGAVRHAREQGRRQIIIRPRR